MNQMKFFLLFTALFAAVFTAAPGLTQNPLAEPWRHADGPYGGSVWALHITLEGLFLAGTLSHGVWFSSDTDRSWIQSGLDNVSVYDFAEGPDRTLFAATQQGVYRSANGGRSWTRSSTGIDKPIVRSVMVHSSGRVLAATLGGGIYVSDDNGNRWSPANEGIHLPFAFSLVEAEGGVLFAGVTRRIYRSDDGGNRWTEVFSNQNGASVQVIQLVDEQRLFAATQRGLFRSDDGGLNWENAGGQLAASNILDLVYTADEKLVASTRSGIYVSQDRGANWAVSGLPDHPLYSLATRDHFLLAGGNPGVFRYVPR